MSEAKKRLYRFLVEMGRITPEEYQTITGEPYVQLLNETVEQKT